MTICEYLLLSVSMNEGEKKWEKKMKTGRRAIEQEDEKTPTRVTTPAMACMWPKIVRERVRLQRQVSERRVASMSV